MSSTLLATELTNLASEAKRKNTELRNAAEKSLSELKALPATSDQQLAADLSRRPAFIDPFLIACATRNPKFAGSAVNCLQRLIISHGLPKGRLQDALEAFNACTDLGLDVQLKILQALPSLLQNYAEDLKGDLLSGALEVCSSLQSAKVPTVSGVAAATLQQLVASIFDKVVNEDRLAANIPTTNEINLDDGTISLRPAAYDAYRVFRDLALTAEDRKTKFVQFSSLPQESILELIWSCLNANPQIFNSHTELGNIITSNVLPLATRALSEKMGYPLVLRSLRILDVVLARHVGQFPAECAPALLHATHSLDADASPLWKRAMVMEMLRNFFADGNRVIDAYSVYDMADSKSVVQDLLASFVRLSSEKPSVIGLGQQSTVPVGPSSARDTRPESPLTDTAAGMAGIISSAFGVTEVNVAGISSRWSLPRTQCLEQLDKIDAPTVPETYIYALVLECMSSLSDGLAKVILPLTVQHDKPKTRPQNGATDGEVAENGNVSSGRTRSQSFRKRTVPLNPLDQGAHPAARRVEAVHGLVESCWPAVLATSSTFLNAALDDQYFRNLIKAYQRFAQVAGLLRLSTARDALMTTLGKAAVPPHVLNTALAEPPRTPATESPRVFSNSKSLLSVDSFVSQVSGLSSERDRRGSLEPQRPMLTTRNLLCLRALLNLAIALGPTLETAFAVVVDTLRQADVVLSATSPQQMVRQGLSTSQKGSESPNIVQAFSNEVAAVEAAASRLLESTADYPDEAFLNVLNTFCRLLHDKVSTVAASPKLDSTSPPPTPILNRRTFSGLTGLSMHAELQVQNYKFVIPKLGNIAELNVSRFVAGDPTESGWNVLNEELVNLASNNSNPKEARRAATDVMCKVAAEIIAEVMEDEIETKVAIQRRTLAVLLRLIDGIYAEDGELTPGDIEIQGHVVDALRAILERSGESLVAGWNRTVAIISSVFERSGTPPDRHDDEETHIDWEHVSKELVSVQLGRTAFTATQLICSDFLSALATAVIPSLIELLHRFASQNDDLNVSLTTVTMAWNVSDFLLRNVNDKDLDAFCLKAKEADDLGEEVNAAVRVSGSAQWLLLLLRLQDITNRSHKEVRKAAFQTICSIFKNNGDQLTPATWDLTLRSIVLRIAFHDVFLYHPSNENEESKEDQAQGADEGMTISIISGTSEVISQHLRLIEQIPQLPSLWEGFLSRLEAYLDLERNVFGAAVYQALTRVLSRITTGSKTWTGPMYRTLALWLKRNPAMNESEATESNQDTLVAYVDAGVELYRLTQQSMSMSQTRTLVENLYLAIRHSDGPRYRADVSGLSPLQAKVLDLLKTIRSDSPSTMIVVAAKLVTLHLETSGVSSNDGPTFVAISSEALDWMSTLVRANIADDELWESGVLVTVIQNLSRLVAQKYASRLEYKGIPIWRRATTVAIALVDPLLEQYRGPQLDVGTRTALWTECVRISDGIVHANGLERVEDRTEIYNDQMADIGSLQELRALLIPGLGNPDLPDSVRMEYCRSLLEVSVIHPTEPNEVPEFGESPLQNLSKVRRGRVKSVPCSLREQMCYECLSDLISLTNGSDGSVERENLAHAAVPFLTLRLAIPIRAYIADQPLRGRRPQPLSELEELLFCFEAIQKLLRGPEDLSIDTSKSGRSKQQMLVRQLYPLLVEAVGTAGDRWSGADEVLTPLQALLRDIVPVP